MTLAATYALLSVLCISLLGGLYLLSLHLSQRESPWWEGAFCGLAVSGGALAMAWCLLHPTSAANGALLLAMAAVVAGLWLTQRPRRLIG